MSKELPEHLEGAFVVKPGEIPSSVASACSGADARRADKRSEDVADEIASMFMQKGRIASPHDYTAAVGAVREVLMRSEVSPRSSDGKIADKALEIYRLFQSVSSRGVGYVLLEDRLVRISIESHKITDESRDG